MANENIKAHLRMEERYHGLQLVFGLKTEEEPKILKAIADLKNEMGLNPSVFENNDPNYPEKRAIYLEFNDDFDREGGDFFENLLSKLDINGCH